MSRCSLFNRTSWLCLLALIIASSLAAAEPEQPGVGESPRPISDPEPAYDAQADVPAKLDAIEQEVARLRRVGATSRANSLSTQLDRLRLRLDGKPSPTEEPEVHVVGVYEGLFPDGPRKYGRVTVEVDDVDAPLILVLCACEPIRWDLRLGKNVNLKRLILAGYGDQELLAPIEGIAVEEYTAKGRSDKYFYAYQKKSDSEGGYARAVKVVRELTDSDVRTLVGEYRPRNGTLIVGPSNEDWRRQRVLAEAEPLYVEATAMSRARQRERFAPTKFQAIHWKIAQRFQGTAEWGDFTPAGPVEGTLRTLPQGVNRVTVDPRGPTFYAIHHEVARFDPKNNRIEKLEIEGDLPELSWGCGVAFDTKRNRLVIVSLGGEGFMYALDVDKNQWSLLRSMEGTDLECLTYAPDDDSFYGLGPAKFPERTLSIHVFDAAGRTTKLIRPSIPISADRMRPHDAPAQLVPLGEHIAVLTASPDGGPMTCMMIDKKTGQTVHAGPMRPVAASRPNITDQELTRLWDALRDGDPNGAREAEEAMAGAGQRAVAFIRTRMEAKPAPADAAQVAQLIKQLDAEQAPDREKAASALRHMGPLVEPHLREAQRRQSSAEASTRIDLLLRQSTDDDAVSLEAIEEVVNADLRREARAIRALARIGSPASVELLRELASTPTGLTRARYARAALREP